MARVEGYHVTTALQPMNGIKMGDTTNFPNCLAVGYTFNF
jgi:hypothetical protein